MGEPKTWSDWRKELDLLRTATGEHARREADAMAAYIEQQIADRDKRIDALTEKLEGGSDPMSVTCTHPNQLRLDDDRVACKDCGKTWGDPKTDRLLGLERRRCAAELDSYAAQLRSQAADLDAQGFTGPAIQRRERASFLEGRAEAMRLSPAAKLGEEDLQQLNKDTEARWRRHFETIHHRPLRPTELVERMERMERELTEIPHDLPAKEDP